MNSDTKSPHFSKPKKTWLLTSNSIASFCVIIALGYTWKKNIDSKAALISNRVIASKNSKLGIPFPENFDQIVDLNLLEKDALNGNQISQDAWVLYQHRKSTNELLVLGKPTPETAHDRFDFKLMKTDADAGNANAALKHDHI